MLSAQHASILSEYAAGDQHFLFLSPLSCCLIPFPLGLLRMQPRTAS